MLINLRPGWGRALVVGAGAVGWRKARNLRDSGFAVTVVSPAFHASFRGQRGFDRRKRAFRATDLRGVALVVACTDRRTINERIGRLCRERGLLVCVCDAPAESTFWGVASVQAGNVEVGVSSEGRDPRRSKELLQRLRSVLIQPD